MATLAHNQIPMSAERRFFLTMAIAMVVVIVAGFSTQLAMGRSSFNAPVLLHFHAVIFFGWTFFYLLQSTLAATGSVALHRTLGWIGAGWATVMVVLGTVLTVVKVQKGTAPFFFEPAYFLVMDCLSLWSFGGLVAAAIAMRKRMDWHRRLMLCAMTVLTGPAIGRLIPMPFLIPYAGWAVFICIMVFPVIGMVRDLRRTGSVHTSWYWGAGTITMVQIAMSLITFSSVGVAIYEAVVAGTPGASVPPLAFPPPPPGL